MPGDQKIAFEEAKAAFNAIGVVAEAGDWARVDGLLERFEKLLDDHPDDPEIALEQAKGAFNLIAKAAAAGDWSRVETIEQRLLTLAYGFSSNEELVAVVAGGVVMRYFLRREAGQSPSAEDAVGASFAAERRIRASVVSKQTFMIGTSFQVIADARRRFPENPDIAALVEALTKVGIDFEQVAPIETGT